MLHCVNEFTSILTVAVGGNCNYKEKNTFLKNDIDKEFNDERK